MGRDDNGQSVGMYSNRLKKNPPSLRRATKEPGATMDKAADSFPPLMPATRAQGTDSGLKTDWRKEHNFKDHTLRRSLQDLALPAAVAEPPSEEISIDERERLLQQHATRKELIPENEPADSPKIPPLSAEYDTLKARLSPWEQTQIQNDKDQLKTMRSSQSETIPAEMLKKSSRNKYSSVLWSDSPEPNRRFVLARPEKEKASCRPNAPQPRHISDEHLSRARSPSGSQHILGETNEYSRTRFNRRLGTSLDPEYLQQSRKRPLHEMDKAGAGTQSSSRTPLNTPPKSVKKGDLQGARKCCQVHTASVPSTDSTAEADPKRDTKESKDDIEKELAVKMREISLDDDLLHQTPLDSQYGSNTEAAKDRLISEVPDGLGIVPKKRKSKAREDYELCKRTLEKLGADTIDNNSKTDLSERRAGGTALRKLTQDQFDHLSRTTSHDFNAKDLENLRARTRLERLPINSLSPGYPWPSSQPPKPNFLTMLPFELRRFIYLHLLTTPKPIYSGELLLDARTTIITPADVPPSLNLSISSTFLRTCRAIYTEALPILYQENCFVFSKVSMLHMFRAKGLAISRNRQDSPYENNKSTSQYLDSISAHDFAFNAEPQGRLCLLRKVHLRFKYPGRSPNLRGMRSPLRDDMEWYYAPSDPWTDFLNEGRYADADDVAGYITFPALRNLVLDFSEWDLKPSESLRIRVFERRFRGEGGLRELTTVGLSHEGTIEAFRERLLARGGVMRVLERGALTRGAY